jgi:hypothetical protein
MDKKKKMKNIILLLIVVNFSFLSCCKKDHNSTPTSTPEQLPPETQEGKNTFGCLIDGEIFLPAFSFPGSSLIKNYEDAELWLGAINSSNKQTVRIEFYNIKSIGQYIINNDSSNNAVCNINSKDFYCDSLHTGVLNLTRFDSLNHIVAGTFYFDAINSSGEVVHVTSGRFDLKYAY